MMRTGKFCHCPLILVACVAAGFLGLSASGAFGEGMGHPQQSSARTAQDHLTEHAPPEPSIKTDSRSLPATHELRVLGSVLRPTDSDALFSSSGQGGCVFATASPNTFFNTFVDLPHGVTLLQVRFYFNDTSNSDSFALLTGLDYLGNVSTEWRMDSWDNTGSGYDTETDINHMVDTTALSYVLRWRPVVTGSTMQACGFRLWYFDPKIFSSGFETGDTSMWSATVQ